MPKIWVARTTVNIEKKEGPDGLTWIYFEFRHMQLSALRKQFWVYVAFKECSFDLQNKFVREVEL